MFKGRTFRRVRWDVISSLRTKPGAPLNPIQTPPKASAWPRSRRAKGKPFAVPAVAADWDGRACRGGRPSWFTLIRADHRHVERLRHPEAMRAGAARPYKGSRLQRAGGRACAMTQAGCWFREEERGVTHCSLCCTRRKTLQVKESFYTGATPEDIRSNVD
ncbi:hypothetical protein FQN60_004295 [Etheostoma spectabile]|uniref:Uncharacterized protein n=1 Tax=Etheostoma spectabile TaxID=54343 RepID=A0A5J5D234_9PERO|nr:hypothetical protein FQN60_004295 [Etheostoma spectabile]